MLVQLFAGNPLHTVRTLRVGQQSELCDECPPHWGITLASSSRQPT